MMLWIFRAQAIYGAWLAITSDYWQVRLFGVLMIFVGMLLGRTNLIVLKEK